MKSRHISVFDYLQALQQEYICLEIRSKIYIHKNDREYFKGLMSKKRMSIMTLADKNSLSNIIVDEPEYMRVWKTVVPAYGLPNFIYNIVNVSDKQLTFPYKGTVVEVEGKCGVTERVNFDDNTVTVLVDGQSVRFKYDEVRRLNHQDTDEFYYFYPGNRFKASSVSFETGLLHYYDMKKKAAILNFEGTLLTLQRDEISRIL